METPINLEDPPGKTVGRRKAPLDPLTSSKATAQQWQDALKTGGIPKGVYRFKTHEEADEWLWKMLTRPKKA